jgi:hypothetical protein
MDEMFYAMHVLTIIITCTFLTELGVHEGTFGSYTRNGVMEDAQGYYIHEEDIRGLHVNMGSVEIDSNERRDRHAHVTMRSLHRELQRYRYDNEMIMKVKEEILHRLHVLHNKVNNDSSTDNLASARQVSTSRSHRKRDDHGNDRKLGSMIRHHHYPRKYMKRTHASFGPGRIPCVSCVKR